MAHHDSAGETVGEEHLGDPTGEGSGAHRGAVLDGQQHVIGDVGRGGAGQPADQHRGAFPTCGLGQLGDGLALGPRLGDHDQHVAGREAASPITADGGSWKLVEGMERLRSLCSREMATAWAEPAPVV